MKTLKTLIKETQNLANFVDKTMPKEVSKAWLWTAQNAFLAERNPETGEQWSDRYGIAYGKGFKKVGNVESSFNYQKLHRTGRLLRSLKAKGVAGRVVLSSSAPYARDHNEGSAGGSSKVIKAPYVRGGTKGIITGGTIVARPFMYPSKKVVKMPYTLLNKKMKLYGW